MSEENRTDVKQKGSVLKEMECIRELQVMIQEQSKRLELAHDRITNLDFKYIDERERHNKLEEKVMKLAKRR